VAIEIAAQQYGVTPDQLESTIRLQSENQRVYEENRRRTRELELREAQIEALAKERARFAPQEPQYDVDPVVRPLYDEMKAMKQEWQRERRERAEQEEKQQAAQRLGSELHSHFQTVMRGVPSQSQMDAERFFAGMAELWPDGPPASIPPAQAVERTARYLGIQSNGVPQYAAPRARDPRAQFVVPMTGSATPNGTASLATGPDFTTQRPNETTEQYHQRLLRSYQDIGTMRLPDGTRVSSG